MELIYALRSIIFYVGYVTGLLIFTLLVLPISLLLDEQKRYFYLTRVSLFVIWWARIACGIRYSVEGRGNIPEQPCLVVSNHQSAWETYLLGFLFMPQTTVLKYELIRIPVFGQALQLINPIAIDRSKPSAALKQLLTKGRERLSAGFWVVIYPEGTRVPTGQLGRFNKGAAILATNAKVPLLPVVHNAGRVWPPGQLIKRPGLVTVIIGEPINTTNKTRDEVHAAMVNSMRKLATLSHQSPHPPDSGPAL